MFRMAGQEMPGSRFVCARFMGCLACLIHLAMAAVAFDSFVLELLGFPPGLAGALLDAIYQFILPTIKKLQFIIGKLRDFLFKFALGNVPVSFRCKRAHIFISGCGWPAGNASTQAKSICKYRAGDMAVRRFQKTKHLKVLELLFTKENPCKLQIAIWQRSQFACCIKSYRSRTPWRTPNTGFTEEVACYRRRHSASLKNITRESSRMTGEMLRISRYKILEVR
jgi:hypothetical protein